MGDVYILFVCIAHTFLPMRYLLLTLAVLCLACTPRDVQRRFARPGYCWLHGVKLQPAEIPPPPGVREEDMWFESPYPDPRFLDRAPNSADVVGNRRYLSCPLCEVAAKEVRKEIQANVPKTYTQ
jgi:hypothetical protein